MDKRGEESEEWKNEVRWYEYVQEELEITTTKMWLDNLSDIEFALFDQNHKNKPTIS